MLVIDRSCYWNYIKSGSNENCSLWASHFLCERHTAFSFLMQFKWTTNHILFPPIVLGRRQKSQRQIKKTNLSLPALYGAFFLMFVISLNCADSSLSQLWYDFKLHTSDSLDAVFCFLLRSRFSSFFLASTTLFFFLSFFISLPRGFFRSGVEYFLVVKMLSDQNWIQIWESPSYKTSWFVSYYSSCCWRQKVCRLLFLFYLNTFI